MKAIVLAGGKGERLRPITLSRPKPLVPIIGRPCTDHVLKALNSGGISEIMIAAGYMFDQLVYAIGDGSRYDGTLLYAYEEEPLGTAGAVKKLEPFINRTFVVASGDVLADVDIGEIVRQHREKGAIATMALTHVEDPTQFGIVGLDGDGFIERFKEKPSPEEVFSDLINAGIYILEPEVLDYIPAKTKFDFSKNVFPAILADGKKILGVPLEGLWMDIGRPSDLLEANRLMTLRHGKEGVLEMAQGDAKLIVEGEQRIESGVNVSGAVYLGDGCVIGSGVTLENAYIYAGTTIESNTVIRNSMVLSDSHIARNAVVEDSIICQKAMVEDGARLTRTLVADGEVVRKSFQLDNIKIVDGQVEER